MWACHDCGHNIGLAYETMVGHWYKTVAWRETYACVIRPIGDPRDESIPEDVRDAMLMPPLTKRPPGRRRTKRFPSTGEMPVDSFFEFVLVIIY